MLTSAAQIPPRTSRLLAAGGVVAALVGALIASPAHAAADDDVRWSVGPATESGPDDRVSIQHELEAGESTTDRIAVRNLSESEQTFRLTAADGFTTASGKFDMLATGQPSVDAGTWISMPDEVTVPAGETATVPIEISVPEQAEPGDHPAGVAASFTTTQTSSDGTSLGVESRVGVKVMTRVAGEIAPALTVGTVAADYQGSWNPFQPGDVTGTVELTNDGNTRLSVTGTASTGTGTASVPGEGTPAVELLPGDTREIEFAIDGVWPTFLVAGAFEAAPVAAAMDGTETVVDPVTSDIRVTAMPWPQLLVLLALVLLVGAVLGNRSRSRRRLDALLAEAREEGRRTAQEPDDADAMNEEPALSPR